MNCTLSITARNRLEKPSSILFFTTFKQLFSQKQHNVQARASFCVKEAKTEARFNASIWITCSWCGSPLTLFSRLSIFALWFFRFTCSSAFFLTSYQFSLFRSTTGSFGARSLAVSLPKHKTATQKRFKFTSDTIRHNGKGGKLNSDFQDGYASQHWKRVNETNIISSLSACIAHCTKLSAIQNETIIILSTKMPKLIKPKFRVPLPHRPN